MTRCPWCGEPHDAPLVLCVRCERLAVASRKRAGLVIRPVQPQLVASGEPDE